MNDEPNDNQRFEPVYDETYDKVVKPALELRVPVYFVKFWVPRLSHGAALLYLHLRSMCWYDVKNPQNTRDFCWPKQETLGNTLRCSERQIRRYLSELELSGLIRRKAQYDYIPVLGKRIRLTDIYQVPYRLPLVQNHQGSAAVLDAVQILEDGQETSETQENGHSTYRTPMSGRSGITPTGLDLPDTHVRPDRTPMSYRSNTNEVINPSASSARVSPKGGSTDFARDPRVVSLTPPERARKDALALELGAWVKQKAGVRDTDPHAYEGLHRRAAYFMPEALVREAMRELTDRLAETREGTAKNPIHDTSRSLWAFLKRKAEQNGIDLEPRPDS